jgi:muramoyltetrapeptide carboxypeptidase
VAVVAPAGPPSPRLVEDGLRILAGWGLDVLRGKHLLDRHPSLDYLAGADADRAADLQAAWCDPTVAAVFCARGGYGSLRIMEHLDWTAMTAAPPKILIGSSDITVVHSAIGARCDVVTMFAPMPATAAFVDGKTGQPTRAAEQLRRVLFAPECELVLRGAAAETLTGGRCAGVTVGGNLSLLVSQLGVPGLPPPPPGAIALVEDVGEAPYRIDHFVTHLLHAGWFDRISGIALGSWDRCGDLAEVRRVMTDRLGGLGVPIIWEHGFGHGPGQLTVPLGVEAELDADVATLTLLAPALS